MPTRIILLVTSPRLPVGLLTATAWDLLRAHPVLAAEPERWADPLRAAGVRLLPEEGAPDPGSPLRRAPLLGAVPEQGAPDQGYSLRRAPLLGAVPEQGAPDPAIDVRGEPSSAAGGAGHTTERLLAAAAAEGTVIWLAGPDGDPAVARDLGLRLAREPGLAELEVVYGSWDPPGARLLDAVAVIDRLVSPGGDPWKQQQTHASLAPYLLEEAYEAHDAIEAGDLSALREELGDVLLQVLLHARLAEQLPDDQRWSVDDVAAEFVAKMVRRNPHVFAGVEVADLDEIVDNWERIKQSEKARLAVLDGVPLAQPALSLAGKLLARAERAGADLPVPAAPAGVRPEDPAVLGEVLLGIVAAARAAGVDAEAALRRAVLAHADRLAVAAQDP